MGEPAENPAPLKKRRRRWLIVALLLVLLVVSGAAWWNWPRGDARFVGKWAMTRGEGQSPIQIFVLRRNGLGTSVDPGASNGVVFPWRVEDGWLIFGSEPPGLLRPVVRLMAEAADKVSTHMFLFGEGEERLRIGSVTPERVDFTHEGPGERTSLRRIP
jgi:hypothetical protein